MNGLHNTKWEEKRGERERERERERKEKEKEEKNRRKEEDGYTETVLKEKRER